MHSHETPISEEAIAQRILIDENTRVLDTEGNPIDGLYAAGEVTGGFHGRQRVDGSGLGDSFVFGRIAGNTIADAVMEE